MDDDVLITAEEVSKMLNCSNRHVRTLADLGHISCINIGASKYIIRRFSKKAVEQYIESRKLEAVAHAS